jgi:ABC-2 type transport system permease protein
MDLLRTLPITEMEIVLGKFLPGLVYVSIMSIGMTLVYIVGIAEAPWYLVAAGLPGLILAGLYAYAIGMLASSFADNYLTALMIATGILTVIDVGGFLSGLLPSPAKEIFAHMHSVNQYLPFTRGVIPLRGTVYFASMITVSLFLTVRSLQSRRWSGNDE